MMLPTGQTKDGARLPLENASSADIPQPNGPAEINIRKSDKTTK